MDSTTSIILAVIITGGFTILSIVVTLWWSHKETLKLLKRIDESMKKNHEDAMAVLREVASVGKDTKCLLEKTSGMVEKMNCVVEKMNCMMEKMSSMMEKMNCMLEKMHLTLEKVHDGNIANAKMQGCDVLCDVERKEDAEKYGVVIHYSKDTKLAWVRPKQTVE